MLCENKTTKNCSFNFWHLVKCIGFQFLLSNQILVFIFSNQFQFVLMSYMHLIFFQLKSFLCSHVFVNYFIFKKPKSSLEMKYLCTRRSSTFIYLFAFSLAFSSSKMEEMEIVLIFIASLIVIQIFNSKIYFQQYSFNKTNEKKTVGSKIFYQRSVASVPFLLKHFPYCCAKISDHPATRLKISPGKNRLVSTMNITLTVISDIQTFLGFCAFITSFNKFNCFQNQFR